MDTCRVSPWKAALVSAVVGRMAYTPEHWYEWAVCYLVGVGLVMLGLFVAMWILGCLEPKPSSQRSP